MALDTLGNHQEVCVAFQSLLTTCLCMFTYILLIICVLQGRMTLTNMSKGQEGCCVKLLMQTDAMLRFLGTRLCSRGFEELEALIH